MKEAPAVLIVPNMYLGWKLEYCQSHNGEGDYQAYKNSLALFAPNIRSLMEKIDKEEAIAVEFSKPVRALIEHYGIEAVEILRVLENRYEYRTAKGKIDTGYVHQLADTSGQRERTVFHDSRRNHALMRRIAAAQRKISDLYELKQALHDQMDRFSIPWLLMEAKRQGAVRLIPTQAKRQE